MEDDDKAPLYNRSFQKKEVVKKLVKNEACEKISTPLEIPESFLDNDSGYLCYTYDVTENKEYEEGFGPRVLVNIGPSETIWKRSRNKWNPFEKIKTVPKDSETTNTNNFKISWDKNGLNSYYVTERMYYYLDKDKHKEKFKSIRAKLYITRMHQEGPKRFLLQFIMDKMTEAEQEQQKRIQKLKEEKRMKKQQQIRKETKPNTGVLLSPTSEFEAPQKELISDSEKEMRAAAFQMSPVWSQYHQHYPYLYEPGYRNTFPPPSPAVAYSLGRVVHMEGENAPYTDGNTTGLENVVYCPMPRKASTADLHLSSSESSTQETDSIREKFSPSSVPFYPQARSFQSFQPARPKSLDFSTSYATPSLIPSVPLQKEFQCKRPRDSDALERLKANFLAATPIFDQSSERMRVTLPPIASFPSTTPIHEVELKHKSISVESLRYCAPGNPEWHMLRDINEPPSKKRRVEADNQQREYSNHDTQSFYESFQKEKGPSNVILSLDPNVSSAKQQEWKERNTTSEVTAQVTLQ